MIYAYVLREGQIERIDLSADAAVPADAIWLDLFMPTNEEALRVNQGLGIELPTREEQVEIEPSSRLYQEGEAIYMTATVLSQSDSPSPEAGVITFIVTRGRLLTLRTVDPRPVATFAQRVTRQPQLCGSAEEALIGLLEQIVDRIADVLEKLSLDLDALSRAIFDDRPSTARRRVGERRDLQAILRSLGRADDLVSTARESLHSLARVERFFTHASQASLRKEHRTRLNALSRDLGSLAEHSGFEARKVNFLLDATLGMINIEQNRIIKIFSVAAVVFLPPTLIASIYGMNFAFMPELGEPWGYPLALGLMVLSAALPYLYFKRKGWL
jgi:magnesium transporter